ncbi:MAG TPA: flagellar FlbD family protein [Pseudobacteroides sp.]|uniref:flagellar FlbD family protein n=1 Tax=Pseudobacteroides sp. TaxID=1968840 RepID=UPI002F91EF16
MIKLTRLNGSTFVLNCELIESVESTPDTVLTTIHGKKLVVSETIDQIVDKVIQYKGKIMFISRDELIYS